MIAKPSPILSKSSSVCQGKAPGGNKSAKIKDSLSEDTCMPLSSAPASLTLIGTVHGDSAGEAALFALLQELRPDRLTVEVSPAALAYRRRRGLLLLQKLDLILDRLAESFAQPRGDLEQHPEILSLRRLLSPPFEYAAASRYAGLTGIPLQLVDDSAVSLERLQRVETELITYRHLKSLVSRHAAPVTENEGYSIARRLLQTTAEGCATFLARCRGSEGIGPRDALIAETIRAAVAVPGHLVHIGGWVHLLPDLRHETLYSRLADLAPQRRLLDPSQPVSP